MHHVIPTNEIHAVLTPDREWHYVQSSYICTVVFTDDAKNESSHSTPVTMLFWQGNGPCTDYYGIPLANIQAMRFSHRNFTNQKAPGHILELLQRSHR
jgi:hypothetical protein